MRPIDEWSPADLEQLVLNGEEENTSLEYKASASLHPGCRDELSRDVSAMANAAGGIIVYGIVEGPDHKPSHIDDGVQDPIVTREWIENILLSNIRPPIQNITIKPIHLAAGTAYVLGIPQATTFAPHQARDGCYYRRRNFRRDRMEDAEIRDVMRRSAQPHPMLTFNVHSLERTLGTEGWHITGKIAISVTNLTDDPILYSTLNVYFEQSALSPNGGPNEADWRKVDGFINHPTEPPIPICIFQKNLIVPSHMPLFKGQQYSLLTLPFELKIEGEYVLGYRVACPGFTAEKVGSIVYSNGEITVPEGCPLEIELVG
jgi:hypothetical protein